MSENVSKKSQFPSCSPNIAIIKATTDVVQALAACRFPARGLYRPPTRLQHTVPYPIKMNRVLAKGKQFLLDLDVLQWLVPGFLAITASGYELFEHWLERGVSWQVLFHDPPFKVEVFIFGLLGPVIIAAIIAWMRRLMVAEQQARQALQQMNQELEARVAERTQALEERNAELARANRELQRLDEMKSEFVALVSHELRAPLTVINGGLELALQDAAGLSQQARHRLERIRQESERLTRFVQTILDISRLEAGRLQLTFGPVAIRPLLEQAAEATLLTGNRQVLWHFNAHLPPVWADETHLDEVIRNLMRNADKYSPPGKPIHVRALLEEDQVRIAIADHGPGIPPDKQESIFERFVRAQAQETAPPGWGLGLYFARKLTEAQHGFLGVRSPIWEDPEAPGAEFYLLLPVAPTPEEEI